MANHENRDARRGRGLQGASLGTLLLLAALLLCSIPSPVSASPGETTDLQDVLVLNSYHPTFVWTESQSEGIIDILENSGLNLSIAVEYLDWKNYQDNIYLNDLAKIFRDKYRSRPFDVILTTDDVALDFVIEHRDDIFGNAPVVFSGVNNYALLNPAERANITGKTEEISPEKTLSSVFMLFPSTSRIYILYEDTETGQGIADRIRKAEPSYRDRTEFVYVTNVTFDELAEIVRSYPAGSVIISSFTRDREGMVMDHNRVMELLAYNSQVPVFSMYDMAMGYGAIGGSILSGQHEGEIAGMMAIRILEGEPVSAIPVNTEDTTLYMFDQKQLDRFSIPDSRLPAGSIVINSEPGILDLYFFEVMTAIIVIAILSIGLIILTINIRIRKNAEEALRESESRFRSLYEDNPTMYFSVDSEGTVMSVNEYGCTNLGYSRQELIGWPVVNIFHDEDKAAAVSSMKQCIENTGKVFQWELRKIRKDGSVIWVRETARALQIPDGTVFILIVCEDITERRKAEEELLRKNDELLNAYEQLAANEEELRINYENLIAAERGLRESERKFRAIFDQTYQFIGLITPEGRIIESNRSGLEFAGIDESDVLGKFFWDTPWWAHSKEMQERLQSAIKDAAGGKFVRFEATHSASDGSLHYIDFSIKPVMDETGRVVMLIPEGRDMTERKKAEDSLNRATGKLNLLNQITFRDIQNAIFSLSGYLELEKLDILDEKNQEYLGKQIALVHSITSSLKFARQYQNLGLKPPAWQNVKQSFLYGISHLDLSDYTRRIDIDKLEIYADPMLENVFYSLAENVVLHGRGATDIMLRYEENQEELTIFFEDNGTGIPMDMKENIFDRRFEEKKGMGLFLSKEILGVTEITITETGEPGRGARFEIHIPKGAYRFTDEY